MACRTKRAIRLFINFTHHLPPFCHADKGVLVILFPFDKPPYQHSEGKQLSPAGFIKHRYHQWEWKKRIDSYQETISISQFTRNWATERWAIDSQVINPPVDTDFRSIEKSQMILSVGRFATEGHSKNQLDMMRAFHELAGDQLAGWSYSCVGGLADSPTDRSYFEQVLSLGRECGAETIAMHHTSLLEVSTRRQRFFGTQPVMERTNINRRCRSILELRQ